MQEFIVSTLEDENDGDFSQGDLSLREAIAQANDTEGEDSITFDSSLSGGTITFNESLDRSLIIDDSVSITGLGQDNLTLDGGFIFTPQADVSLEIEGLNLVGGKIDSFGSLVLRDSTISQTIETGSDSSAIISREALFINDSTIRDNSGGDNVGILIESGIANIQNSLIANNEGVLGGSGILILTDDTVNIRNSTITGNSNRSAAGIVNAGGSDRVNIFSNTITDNNGGMGNGGIQNSSGTVTVTSNILAGNTGGSNLGDIAGDGEFISGGNNLISNGDDAAAFVNLIDGDLVGSNGDDPENPQVELLLDPLLGELQDNGGATETFALLEGSPAIDAGRDPTNLSSDQRGSGFLRRVGVAPDIGAFEVQEGEARGNSVRLIVSTLEDENDGDLSVGDLSLREAIAIANSDDIITFDPSLTGGTITLTEGELLVEQNFLTIQGLGADNITIDANRPDNVFTNFNTSRVFNIDNSSEIEAEIVINDLTITGGSAVNGLNRIASGAGILNRENLEINNAIVRDNNAVNGGGGIFSDGTLTVNNSAIYNNDAGRGAGGGIFNSGTATINQSTLASNNDGGVRGGDGGGVGNTGTLAINNSTVTNNSSSGISNQGGEITLTSTIVAGNFDNNDLENDDIISGGNNLIGGEATLSSTVGSAGGLANIEASDLVGTANNPIDPLLGELQNNGGSTPTIALLDGSPAIDAGSNPLELDTDQRGEEFDRTIGAGTDIGAFELEEGNEDDGGNEPPDPALLGDDVINGTRNDDVLLGGEGNNILYGFRGDDLLEAGSGNDTLDANQGDDTINAGGGNDIITAGPGNDTINAGAGSDTIDGGSDGDRINAGAGDDLINANIGDDTLTGGAGNDTLIGGGGDDFLTGNAGSDLFVLDAQGGANTIQDFNPSQDTISLTDDITFADLTITGSSDAAIAFEGETIGIVADFAASDLTADNFAIYEI